MLGDIPFRIGKYLYFGIIDGIKQCLINIVIVESASNGPYIDSIKKSIDEDIENLRDAVKFYNEHAIVSGKYLEEEFNDLQERYTALKNRGDEVGKTN